MTVGDAVLDDECAVDAGCAVASTEFDAFVAARGQGLTRLAAGLLHDRQHAEDVVQEVLARAHQNWPMIRSRENPEAYVRVMVVNATRSFWRRAARGDLSVDPATFFALAVSDESDRVESREVLVAALRRLPPKQRAVLVLRHYEGLSDADIARAMGTSEVTVRSNVHRGLARMRLMLKETA